MRLNPDLDELVNAVSGARIVDEAGNGEILELENELASARIALKGAKVLSFIPRGGVEVIGGGTSPDVTSHRGIPVCWPWFGSAGNPSHGFVRNAMWKLAKLETTVEGGHRAVFAMEIYDIHKLDHPKAAKYDFDLTLMAEIGSCLEVSLGMFNRSNVPCNIGCALHTYFNVSDLDNVAVRGLDGVRYVDHTAAGGKAEKRLSGDVKFTGEVDWVFSPSRETTEIVDAGFKRIILIEKTGSGSTVVWNPGAELAQTIPDLAGDGYRKMVCIEAANAFGDVRNVAGQSVHALTQKISCLSL